jgi:hypothetical protein
MVTHEPENRVWLLLERRTDPAGAADTRALVLAVDSTPERAKARLEEVRERVREEVAPFVPTDLEISSDDDESFFLFDSLRLRRYSVEWFVVDYPRLETEVEP